MKIRHIDYLLDGGTIVIQYDVPCSECKGGSLTRTAYVDNARNSATKGTWYSSWPAKEENKMTDKYHKGRVLEELTRLRDDIDTKVSRILELTGA